MSIKCFECKKAILKEDVIVYKEKRCCEKCYKEKRNRELFIMCICDIFKVRQPSPHIYMERKRLMAEKGYDDITIVNTLDYLYKVKKLKPEPVSLYKVTPENVEEARRYYSKSEKTAEAINEQQVEYIEIVPQEIKPRVPKMYEW